MFIYYYFENIGLLRERKYKVNSSTTYNNDYELLVSILAEMTVSYFAKPSIENEKARKKDVKEASVLKEDI